jgi:hypothetical protein
MASGKSMLGMLDAAARAVADLERLLDEALGETYPASDPISVVLRRPDPDELRAEPSLRQHLHNQGRRGIAETGKTGGD